MKKTIVPYFWILIPILFFTCIEPDEDVDLPFLQYHVYPDWSADGEHIVYQRYPTPIDSASGDTFREPAGIYIYDFDTDASRLVIEGYFNNPSFSPDGEWITYGYNRNIYKVDTSGTNVVQLRNNNNDFFPVWSPNGDLIAYDNTSCGDGICGIYITPTNGAERQYMMPGRKPAWSGDGQYLYSISPPPHEITKKHASQDSVAAPISNLNNNDPRYISARYVSVCPTSDQVLVTVQEPGTGWGLVLFDQEQSSISSLFRLYGFDGEWSPTGEAIVYTHLETGLLNIYEIETNTVVVLTDVNLNKK